ncbi:MAG: hypothetical protein GXO87_02240 [Chlorobi bacterium]|nr:hypothetical protein [Chlorobiota bacterium]
MSKFSAFNFALFFALIFSACSTTNSDDDCICTDEFRSEYVFILDSEGVPLDSLQTLMINETTGDTLANNNGAFVYERGMYWLIDDNYVKDLTTAPQTFIFTAENGATSVGAVYQFATDNCKCHIEKVSGPDTLRIK